MTGIESIEALLRDLTVDNQHEILPILADALLDAGLDRQEQALRWALLNSKYPTTHRDIIWTAMHKQNQWFCAWHYESYIKANYPALVIPESHSFLPEAFQECMKGDNTKKHHYHGRYFNSIEGAWRSFLLCAGKHLEKLK